MQAMALQVVLLLEDFCVSRLYFIFYILFFLVKMHIEWLGSVLKDQFSFFICLFFFTLLFWRQWRNLTQVPSVGRVTINFLLSVLWALYEACLCMCLLDESWPVGQCGRLRIRAMGFCVFFVCVLMRQRGQPCNPMRAPTHRTNKVDVSLHIQKKKKITIRCSQQT